MWYLIVVFFLLISHVVVGDEESGDSTARLRFSTTRTNDLIYRYKPREDVRSICLKCESNLCSLIPNDNNDNNNDKEQVDTMCYQGENVPVYLFFNKADNNVRTTHHMRCGGGCSGLGYTAPSTTTDVTIQSWSRH